MPDPPRVIQKIITERLHHGRVALRCVETNHVKSLCIATGVNRIAFH